MGQDNTKKFNGNAIKYIGLAAIGFIIFVIIVIIANSVQGKPTMYSKNSYAVDSAKIVKLYAYYDLYRKKPSISGNDYKRVHEVIDTLTEMMPSITKSFDNYGKSMDIDTAKLFEIDFIKANKSGFLTSVELEKKDALLDIAKKEKQFKEMLASLKSSYNKFNETSYYRDKTSPIYVNRNGFYLTFAVDKGETVPRNLQLNIQYYADDWLFIDNYQFYIDGETFRYSPDKVERDNGNGGMIWEWSVENLNSNTKNIIEAIIKSKQAEIKFNGSQYYNTKIISNAEKKALNNVMTSYKEMGGLF